MRNILLVALLFGISNVTISQILGGHLVNDKASGLKEGYYFWEDGEFSWFKFLGDQKSYGRGTYVIGENQVELKFGKARRQFDLASEESRHNGTSKSTIEVGAITSAGEPIPRLRIYLEKSGIETITNEIGYARLEITNAMARDIINFEFEDYRTFNTTLTLRGRDWAYVISIDKKINYVEFENRTLELVQPKGMIRTSKGLESNTFKRTSKKRYLNIYHRF